MNEKNSFAEDADAELTGLAALDPKLLNMLIEGSKTPAGLAIIAAALEAVKAEPISPSSSDPGVAATGEGSATPPAASLATTNSEPVQEMHELPNIAPVAMGEADALDLGASADQSQPFVGAGEARAPHQSDERLGTSPAGAEGDEDRQPQSDAVQPDPVSDDGKLASGIGMAGEASAPASSADETDALVAHTLSIRPKCQHPDLKGCGGYGRKHCPACEKAMGRFEEAA